MCVGLGCFAHLSTPKLGFSVGENCCPVLLSAQTVHAAPAPTGCIQSQGAIGCQETAL